MHRASAWAKTRDAWRKWGKLSCIVLAYFLVAHQVLAAADGYEQVHSLLSEFEHLELDEIVLLAAMAFPVACIALWIQSHRLKREVLRRRALDALMTELFNRTCQLNPEKPVVVQEAEVEQK